MKVFVSYSSKDRQFVEGEILPLLKAHGLQPWYATADIQSSQEWERSLRDQLKSSDWLLVVLSKGACESRWVRAEVHWALENMHGRVVPVLFERCNPIDLHLQLPGIQHVDYTAGLEDARRKLLAVWDVDYASGSGPPVGSVRFRKTRWCLAVGVCSAVLTVAVASGLLLLHGGGGAGTNAPTRNNWWNFYERGLVLRDMGDMPGAIREFETAIGVRPGAKFPMKGDSEKIKTYGVRYIEGYYPNCELGIAYYKAGVLDRAAAFLEESIAQAPSARAEAYLSRVRCAGGPEDGLRIGFETGCLWPWWAQKSRLLQGFVQGDSFYGNVRVNGVGAYGRSSSNGWEFCDTVVLSNGLNVVSVEARDCFGHVAMTNLTWTLDGQPPVITKVQKKDDRGSWVFEGYCEDDVALRCVSVNGVVQKVSERERTTNGESFSVRIPASSNAFVTAEDMAGNQRREEYAPPLASGVQDLVPPILRLVQEAGMIVAFADDYYVEGEASDENGLSEVTIDGQSVLAPSERGAVAMSFGGALRLKPGTNEFTVSAADLYGNKTIRSIVVVKVQPKAAGSEVALIVAVPPVLSVGTDDAKLAGKADEGIEAAMHSDGARLRASCDSQKWRNICIELALCASDLADPREAVRVANKVQGVDVVLTSTLLRQDRGVTMLMRAIDAEDGRILMTADAYTEDTDDMSYLASSLVRRIESRLTSSFSCGVQKVDGDMVSLSAGLADHVKVGTKLMVYGENEIGRGCAKRLKDGKQVFLTVNDADAHACRARVEPPGATDIIKVGDIAVSWDYLKK